MNKSFFSRFFLIFNKKAFAISRRLMYIYFSVTFVSAAVVVVFVVVFAVAVVFAVVVLPAVVVVFVVCLPSSVVDTDVFFVVAIVVTVLPELSGAVVVFGSSVFL